MKAERIWQVKLSYMCASFIEGPDGVITVASPILRWTLGKKPQDVIDWVSQKNGRCLPV